MVGISPSSEIPGVSLMHLASMLGPLHEVLLFFSSPLVCCPSLGSAQVHSVLAFSQALLLLPLAAAGAWLSPCSIAN